MSRPKDTLEKLQEVLNAWSTLADNKKFAGMTVDDFRALVTAAIDDRAAVEKAEAELTAAIAKRDTGDDARLAKVELVVNAVRGDPTEGPDSPLLTEMGYTRKSTRKSGLTRKKKPPKT